MSDERQETLTPPAAPLARAAGERGGPHPQPLSRGAGEGWRAERAGVRGSLVFTPLQARFLTIPQTPLCYWLRERFFELLAGPTLGDIADVVTGLQTSDDDRFVRFVWEVRPEEWLRPLGERRWVPFEKGGGYGKWFGYHWWVVDWEDNGARIKATPGPRVQNEQHYFREGWTYSYMARGSLGVRKQADSIFAHKSPGVFARDKTSVMSVVANCRFAGHVARAISATIQLPEGCVARVPLPERIPDVLVGYESACVALKRWLVARDLTERTFGPSPPSPLPRAGEGWPPGRGEGLPVAWRLAAEEAEAIAAVLHTLEGLSEREVFTAYRLDEDDIQAVLDETGTPAGWYPLIAGYNALPPLPEVLAVDGTLLEPLAREPRRALSPEELADLKRRLRALYEAGPGVRGEDAPSPLPLSRGAGEGEGGEGELEGNENEEEAAVLGAHIPIPAETFLEELSQKLEVHPISVYWLLKELREQEGVICLPELRRFVEDYVTVVILRLLGYRWPKQVEAGEPVPAWAEPDGVIPLTEGTGRPTLLDRVRERIAADFGDARVDAIEQEFRQIMGRSLEEWLARQLFPAHVSRFRKRPIAWLLESGHVLDPRWEVASPRRRGQRAGRIGGPAFACLVAYHKLTADTLARIKTHVLRPVLQRREYELGEERRRAAAGQVAARAAAERLAQSVDELKAFEAALDRVSERGFWSQRLEELLAKEQPDTWARRTPTSPVPDRDAFLRQEQAYDPDINDGVRVNIAPLQKYGLLAAEVLAPKDVDRAIADRAKWRADERRWCREGKLPKPGWWRDHD